MTSTHRLIYITAATLALGLAAGCEQKTSTEGAANNARSDRTGQSSERSAQQPTERTESAAAEVQREAGGMADKAGDTALTAKVKSAIFAEPGLKSMEIDVDTVDGIVTLTGTVDSPQHIESAKQAAQKVDGVKSVNNQLTVKASS